jgi:deoxynucleotidyltransferase terminal-interacting protein 1
MSGLIPEIRIYSPTESIDSNRDNSIDNSIGWGFGCDQHSNDSSIMKRSQQNVISMENNESNNGLKDKQMNSKKSISWDNTFHMRNMNLMNFATNSGTYRTTYRSQTVSLHRARMGGTTSSAKSLNILRQTLQHSINKEINEVIQKYLDRFFRPAVDNIRNNNGVNSVSEQHIQAVCRQILEEAKKMYFAGVFTRSNSPITAAFAAYCNNNLTENLSDNENNNPIPEPRIPTRNKRNKDSDSDSEASSLNTLKPIVSRKKVTTHKHSSNANSSGTASERSTPVKFHSSAKGIQSDAMKRVKRDARKWDPNRLSTQTKFVLGSRANKALGFGSTRGRLYTKHADLFRYIGDQEDKQWLHDNHLMPPAGGRAYLLIKEDILDLIESDEYKNAPGVNANDMGEGFTVPESMIIKMATVMQNMRNSDMSRKKIESKSRTLTHNPLPSIALQSIVDNSSTNRSNAGSNEPSVETSRPESGAVSPADDLEILSTAEMPSTDPSPFSIGASCFESDVSPNENQEISPIPSDISTNTLNDI